MKNNKISKLFQWIGYSLLGVFAVSCSLRNPNTGMTTIEINLPQHQNASRVENPASYDSVLNALFPQQPEAIRPFDQIPTSLSSFNCYAVNISGGGISPAPGTTCPSNNAGQYIGVYDGMFSAGPQQVTLSVPNGAGYVVQLLGFDSTSSPTCQSLAGLFSGAVDGNGTGSPYVLATANLDVSSDTTLSMTATFDSSNPITFGNQCGVGNSGPSFAATAGFTGVRTVNGYGPNPAPTTFPNAVPSPTDYYLGNPPQPIPTASLLAIQNGNGNLPPVPQNTTMLQMTASASAPAQSAGIRLGWNAATFMSQLQTYPYGKVQLQVSGGQDINCAAGQNFGAMTLVLLPAATEVYPATFTGTGAQWVLVNQSSINNNGPGGWSGGGNMLNEPISNYLVKGTDGNPYLIIDVGSNYGAATGTTACGSSVYVGQASIQLEKGPAGDGNNNSNGLNIQSTVPMGGGPPSNFQLQYNQVGLFYASGGTPPYVFSVTLGGSGAFDSTGVLGIFTANSTAGNTAIQVKDATGATSTATVVTNATNTNAISLQLVPVNDGTGGNVYTAGSCIPFQVTTSNFNGSDPGASGTTSFMASAATGLAAGAMKVSGCGSAFTGGTVNSTTSSASAAFAYTQAVAGTYGLSLSVSSPVPITNPGNATITIVPGMSTSFVGLIGPTQITTGDCVQYSLSTTDAYANPAPTGGTTGVSVTFPVGTGTFFNQAGCSAGDLSGQTVTLTPPSITAPGSIPVWIKGTSSTITLSGITGGQTYKGNNNGVVYNAGYINGTVTAPATGITFSGATPVTGVTCSQCESVTLNGINSAGGAAAPSTTATVQVQGYGSGGWPGFYSNGNCSSTVVQTVGLLTSSFTFSFCTNGSHGNINLVGQDQNTTAGLNLGTTGNYPITW